MAHGGEVHPDYRLAERRLVEGVLGPQVGGQVGLIREVGDVGVVLQEVRRRVGVGVVVVLRVGVAEVGVQQQVGAQRRLDLDLAALVDRVGVGRGARAAGVLGDLEVVVLGVEDRRVGPQAVFEEVGLHAHLIGGGLFREEVDRGGGVVLARVEAPCPVAAGGPGEGHDGVGPVVVDRHVVGEVVIVALTRARHGVQVVDIDGAVVLGVAQPSRDRQLVVQHRRLPGGLAERRV